MKTETIMKDKLVASLQSASKDQIAKFVDIIWQSEEVQWLVLKELTTMTIGEAKKRGRKPKETGMTQPVIPMSKDNDDIKDIFDPIEPPKQKNHRRVKPKDDLPDLPELTDEDLEKMAKEYNVESEN